MGRENREVWAKRIERWCDSGLSATEFADETGVNAKTLRYWKWRLARVSGARVTRPAPKRMRAGVVPFVEVSPPARPVPPAAAADEGEGEAFEIIAPSGMRVRVPARFDDGALARVLRAVR